MNTSVLYKTTHSMHKLFILMIDHNFDLRESHLHRWKYIKIALICRSSIVNLCPASGNISPFLVVFFKQNYKETKWDWLDYIPKHIL